MKKWTIEDSKELYNINGWGTSYFGINEQGDVYVTPCKNDRPLLRGKSQEELITFITEQLEKRSPYYTKAAYTLDVSLMDDYSKIKISVDKLRKLLNI